MALPQTQPKVLPLAQERRRHQRRPVRPLVAPVAGNAGERVIAYVDHLGRLKAKSRALSTTASP